MDLICIDVIHIVTKKHEFHKFVNNHHEKQNTHWKNAQAFFVHFRQVTDRPIKLVIYVIFTECFHSIIAYIILIFKRDVIDKVPSIAHIQTKYCISNHFIIDAFLNNTQEECTYKSTKVDKCRRKIKPHFVTNNIINPSNKMNKWHKIIC